MLDLTAVYYTANTIPEYFADNTRFQLKDVLGDTPLISVSKKAIDFGFNIVVDLPSSHLNIYRQALLGAKNAQTKYIALCEDDVLYSPEHFKYRPNPGKFAYNLAAWSVFTWTEPPMFTHKGTVRKNLNSLICERQLFIDAIEERFAKYPTDNADIRLWAEPGKYERQLGVTIRETEDFYTNPPNIIFSHEHELSYSGLGKRKRVGEFRAYRIPYWGDCYEVLSTYKEPTNV